MAYPSVNVPRRLRCRYGAATGPPWRYAAYRMPRYGWIRGAAYRDRTGDEIADSRAVVSPRALVHKYPTIEISRKFEFVSPRALVHKYPTIEISRKFEFVSPRALVHKYPTIEISEFVRDCLHVDRSGS